VAHCVNRADHLLLADHHIVEQAFELRRHPGSPAIARVCDYLAGVRQRFARALSHDQT
jgi:hypothetical protein